MKETAPCPWCDNGGKAFLFLSRKPFMSYTVRCNDCNARGPHVIIENRGHRMKEKEREKIALKAKTEAIEKWNGLRMKLRDESPTRLTKKIML